MKKDIRIIDANVLNNVDGNKKPVTTRRIFLGGTPRQFGPMLDKISKLKYYDTPPYSELRELIREAIKATNVTVSLVTSILFVLIKF